MSRKSRKRDNKKSSADNNTKSDAKDTSESESTAEVAVDSQGESTAEFFMNGGDEMTKGQGSKSKNSDSNDSLKESEEDDAESPSDEDDANGVDLKTSGEDGSKDNDVDEDQEELEDQESMGEKVEDKEISDAESLKTSSTRIEPQPAPKSIAMVDPSNTASNDLTGRTEQGPVKDSQGSFFDRWFAADNGKRLRARKVRRVVRHIDPWSVLTFSVIFHIVVVGSLFIATLLVVVLSVQLNLLEQVETQIQQLFNLEVFEIRLRPLATALAQFSFILVILGTLLHVLFAVIFNLISDLVGGIRVTVVEEEVSASK